MMKRRTKLGAPPSQRGASHGPDLQVTGHGPWQEKVQMVVEMIVIMEKHRRPELDSDAIAERVLKHARVALGLESTDRLHKMVSIESGDESDAKVQETANAAGLIRVVADYARISRDDAIATESFMDAVQKSLKKLPNVPRWEMQTLRDSSGSPVVQFVPVETPDLPSD